MIDIIFYTTPKKLLHKQDKLSLEVDDDKSTEGVYFWRLSNLPSAWKKLEQMDTEEIVAEEIKLYFATEGFIRGYFNLIDIDYTLGWDLEFESNSWRDINPIPIKPFQGFKYADKVKELSEVKPNSDHD